MPQRMWVKNIGKHLVEQLGIVPLLELDLRMLWGVSMGVVCDTFHVLESGFWILLIVWAYSCPFMC